MSESWFRLVSAGPVALALVSVFFTVEVHARPSDADPRAASIVGRAVVIDGDTLQISGVKIRLEGIDAPELAQSCGRRWFGTWDCGEAAAKALKSLVKERSITCHSKGQDKYGRTLGICFADKTDINAELVRTGLAWAFVKYSATYVEEETRARAAEAGIWQGEAEPAWIFRQNRWHTAEQTAPEGCAIKGNVSGNGRVYHLPWSPWYGRVTVNAERGERWFCSEAEARQAGWRPAVLR